MAFYAELQAIAPTLRDEPMAPRTTIKAGGAAAYFTAPKDEQAFAAALRLCRERGVPYYILGNGSNVLFTDAGFPGAVISTGSLTALSASGNAVTAGAGVHLRDLCAFCAERGLSGLERLCGIPGSVGGAVYMNAGAYDDETATHVSSVAAIDGEGRELTLTRRQMAFGYRTSAAARDGLAVLSAAFTLTEASPDTVKREIDAYNARRAEKQPLDDPSAGSTFKRPKYHFAGKLIMDAGLRGFAIGGARVSPKHCGFVVNAGGATAGDILRLIAHIQAAVREQFGVELEPEIRVVGE